MHGHRHRQSPGQTRMQEGTARTRPRRDGRHPAEAGCVSYTLLDNPYDPAQCIFVEEWADLDALRKHAASAHIAEWRKQSRELTAGKTAVTVYQGELAAL